MKRMKLLTICFLVSAIRITTSATREEIKNGDIRLANGNATAGRVELYNNGQWGTVCDDNWDIDDARVVCRQLGFRDVITAHGNALFGEGEGPIHISNVMCSGFESSLTEFFFSLTDNCQHEDDASVTCLPFDEGFLRLVAGNLTDGRVEIFFKGKWGTICDDTWDIHDATVVCRQLGFMGAISAPRKAAFGGGEGPIHLDTVECLGDELFLLDCEHKQKANCLHFEDASVVCFNSTSVIASDKGNIRLANGHASAGRVEIYLDNQWGTICDDDWDIQDATVVCRQLGFTSAISAPRKATFGTGSGPIHLDAVQCSGDEVTLMKCDFKLEADCTHEEDASAECSNSSTASEGDIRLRDGHASAGRVEIYLDNQWGTICDDDWDLQDAMVVCRQLGFTSAISAPSKAAFGTGIGPIHLDSVQCSGDEVTLMKCDSKRGADCTHEEDAGVTCRDNNSARAGWIVIPVLAVLLTVATAIGIKTNNLTKNNVHLLMSNMNLVLRRIWILPGNLPPVDDVSVTSRPSTIPELEYSSDQAVVTKPLEPEDSTELKDSELNPKSKPQTDSVLYTTIPAELILPAEPDESYEVPRDNLKVNNNSGNIY